MTVCYIPPATAAERIRFAIRAFIRTARMRWRRFRATFTPLGWSVILALWAVAALVVYVRMGGVL